MKHESEHLTLKQLEERFKDEWVLLGDPEVKPDTHEILGGRVLAHSHDRDEVYEEGARLKPKRSAILCFREPGEGSILVL